jgi:hypothetical protein
VAKGQAKTLRAALAEAGLAGRPRARLDPNRYVGYLEAHIEQGDYLDSSGLRLGIVTGIVGFQSVSNFLRGSAKPCRDYQDGDAQGCRGRASSGSAMRSNSAFRVLRDNARFGPRAGFSFTRVRRLAELAELAARNRGRAETGYVW